ncbi:hydrolase [Simkania negevensis]|uniref:Hydrolase n=1 Tax=Simkania negevensis TaxID=83561 RepID=A0ABS3AS02_9BACT|nr:hydrolase [Simkania negevensis]
MDEVLHWIDDQQEAMLQTLIDWAEINTGSHNTKGIIQFGKHISSAFAELDATISSIPLPPHRNINDQGNEEEFETAPAYIIQGAQGRRKSLLLSGHLDTVYPEQSLFQKTKKKGNNILQGPGVADMKGGLVVMLYTLKALKISKIQESLSWTVVLNPDEEIGSPSSASLLEEEARNHDIGLVFEPTLPNGTFISERGGSKNFAIIAKGKKAHVGREFHLGKNAITALCRVLYELDCYRQTLPQDTTVNIGKVIGGEALNIVPDFALARFNVRYKADEILHDLEAKVSTMIRSTSEKTGVNFEFHPLSHRSPKPYDSGTAEMFEHLRRSAKTLEKEIATTSSNGVTDGNVLSGAGLSNIDTMGVVGGNLHTHDEYMLINSLSEKTKQAVLFLESMTT